MNQLLAEISDVQTSDNLALVSLLCENETFSSLIIHNENNYVRKGNPVYMVFKETEVMIGKDLESISIRNRFTSVIKFIKKGKLLSEIILNFKGHTITSIITTESCERLSLCVGKEVEALVKTNDLMLIQHH
ncbi:MAG: molybdopterin-binding protein [Flavobacteriales bacterium]